MIKHLLKKILLLCCFLLPTRAYTQPVWHRIATPHYDILFPDNISREAQRIANTLEKLYFPIANTLQVTPARIPIILRNTQCIANGYITLGPPRRGVLYTFPMADPGFLMNSDWLNSLAVHELRHVAQYEYFHAISMISFLAPEYVWVMEGDAVNIETALSTGGRGRSPRFSLLYKVNLLERGGFSYYKQMYRSLKHEIPDHYRIGYFMTTYLRRQYGADAIRQLMLRDSFWQSLNPFAFHTRINKLTGMSVSKVYEAMQLELKALWEQQLEGLHITPTKAISKRVDETYTDYNYPQATKDGVIVLKSGMGTPPQFVKIDEAGKEHIICTPIGLDPSIPFSVVHDTIIWLRNETESATNVNQPTFTTIQAYNIKTKTFKAISSPDRYYAISLSPDGTKVAACISTASYNHSVRIIDATTGDILQQYLNTNNHFYLTPSWSSDSQQVIVVANMHNKATIIRIAMQPHAIEELFPPTPEVISNPVLHNEYIYYNSPYSGIDNIYAINLKTKKRYQVTSSKYGAYHPAITADGKHLIYNDFGRDGMDAVQIALEPKKWLPIEKVADRSLHYYQPLVAQEHNADFVETIPQTVYPVEKLKAKHRFPIFFRPYLLGVAIVKGDLLDKLEWVMLGGRMLNRYITFQNSKWLLNPYTKFTYKAFGPIISLEIGSLIDIAPKDKKKYSVTYSIKNVLGCAMPFIWYAGEYNHNLTLHTQSILKYPLSAKVKTKVPTSRIQLDQTYGIYWSRMSAKSRLDLYSPWGQEVIACYHHRPLKITTDKLYQSSFLSEYLFQYNLYFPGFWQHNHIRLHTTYSNLRANSLLDGNNIIILTLPFETEGQPRLDRWATRLYYDFPIAYLDSIIGWPKRVATHLFYDYAYRPADKQNKSLHTTGISFTLDGAHSPDLCLEFCLTHCITTYATKFQLIVSSTL
jgi:hypothetical protein